MKAKMNAKERKIGERRALAVVVTAVAVAVAVAAAAAATVRREPHREGPKA